jgi:hypothetical protein
MSKSVKKVPSRRRNVRSSSKGPQPIAFPRLVDFPTAIKAVSLGHTATKQSWDNRRVYVRLSGGLLCIRQTDGVDHPLILSAEDLAGRDWIVQVQ